MTPHTTDPFVLAMWQHLLPQIICTGFNITEAQLIAFNEAASSTLAPLRTMYHPQQGVIEVRADEQRDTKRIHVDHASISNAPALSVYFPTRASDQVWGHFTRSIVSNGFILRGLRSDLYRMVASYADAERQHANAQREESVKRRGDNRKHLISEAEKHEALALAALSLLVWLTTNIPLEASYKLPQWSDITRNEHPLFAFAKNHNVAARFAAILPSI